MNATSEIKNTLRKSERLHGRKQINLLFAEGKSIRSGCLRIIYLEASENSGGKLQAMFSAPKKRFRHAVERNLLKRRMREAYRLHNHTLKKFLQEKQRGVYLAFLFMDTKVLDYFSIEEDVNRLLIKLIKQLDSA